MDREREHSPLHPADDAVELDTTGKSVAEVVEQAAARPPARLGMTRGPEAHLPQVAVVGFPNVREHLVNRLAEAEAVVHAEAA